MGVTTTQQQNFLNTYAPLATQAGNQLGVSPTTILAQWANESGWGTSSAAANNNLGGIMTTTYNGGVMSQSTTSFSTPQAFEQAYVNTIQNNFPGATNTGDNVGAFVSGLASNAAGQSYIGPESPTGYTSQLSTLASQIGNFLTSGTSNAATTGTAGTPTVNADGSATIPLTTTSAANSSANTCASGTLGVGGFFSWACWQNIAGDAALIVAGAFILIVAVASGLFGDGARKQLVAVTKKATS